MLAADPAQRPGVDAALAHLAGIVAAAGQPVGPAWLYPAAGSDAG